MGVNQPDLNKPLMTPQGAVPASDDSQHSSTLTQSSGGPLWWHELTLDQNCREAALGGHSPLIPQWKTSASPLQERRCWFTVNFYD